jgi:LuxR family maltose regulon positive regulatory protein
MHDMDVPILITKLHLPARRPDLVSRPRLLAKLDEGLQQQCQITLISAPAGYGKTMLVAEWIAQEPQRATLDSQPATGAAWLSLDANDNDPTRFWTYVVAALQKVRPDAGKTTLAMLRANPPPAMDVMLTALINDIGESATPLILVLDDYQMIQAQPIHDALAFLIEYLAPHMHLVLITRIDPPLNLARLRISRQMAEVRAADLRFTTDEAALFLNQVMGLNLAPEDIAALETRTEGWIAGLQVAAMAMQGRDDVAGFVRAFAGSHRHILGYLTEEVYLRQPEPVRDFLLRTSILNRLSGPLCDALTGQHSGQQTLEQLETANLFVVPLDDEQHWYRYHPLFGDVLRAKLRRERSADEIQALHRAASQWYAQHNQVDEAMQHALLAEDFGYAAALIEQFAGLMIQRSELATLQGWLGALPETQVRTSPRLSMIAAWVLLASNQIEAVEPRLRDIEQALGLAGEQVPDIAALSADLRGALGEVLCIRANLAFHHSDLPRVLALSQQALDCLTDDVETGLFHTLPVLRGVIAFNTALAHEFSGDVGLASERFLEAIAVSRPIGNTHLIMMSFSHLAQLRRIQGHLHRAAETYGQAIQFAQESTLPPSPFLGMVHVGLGDVWYEWNDLLRARAHLEQGIELARPWNNWETLVAGYLDLARIEAAQGMWAAAENILADLANHLPSLQSPWGLPLIRAHYAHLCARRGNLEAAATWVRQTDLTVDGDLIYVREPEAIILAQVLAALGRLDEAARLYARLLAATEAVGRNGRVIELLIGQSLVFQAQNELEAALAALRRALSLAEPEGYVRLFVDGGRGVAALLAQVDALPAYVARLRAAFPGPPAKGTARSTSTTSTIEQPAALVEPLSERELELLRLIAEGLTNQEIAEALTVSLNTVKTHVRSIFGKLDVRNRTEATARAHELGLI